jgi:hypothetical protein
MSLDIVLWSLCQSLEEYAIVRSEVRASYNTYFHHPFLGSRRVKYSQFVEHLLIPGLRPAFRWELGIGFPVNKGDIGIECFTEVPEIGIVCGSKPPVRASIRLIRILEV